MSRQSSRLHTLERGLKAPRKSRTKARALTVMRLEGGATGVQPSLRPARLPKDIEDQIAVVRGRAVGKPSRGLLQLEERLLRTHDVAPAPALIQRHAHDATPPPPAAEPPPPVHAAAMSATVPGSAFSGRFTVESFEDTSMPAPTIPANLFAGVRVEVPPVPQINASSAPSAAVDATPWMQAGANVSAGAVPWATEQSQRAARKRALSADQQAAAESFERDVAAMLGTNAPGPTAAPEDKQWEDTMRNVVGAPPTATSPVASAPVSPPAPTSDAHEVFNQMGLAMNYANRFDLGAVDLSARFDQFDKELALAPPAAAASSAPVPVQALALDDFDLVADLAELSGAQSAVATATATSAIPDNPVPTNPEPAATPAT